MAKEEKVPEVIEQGSSRGIEGDIAVLKQLIESLEESVEKLQEFYKTNDPENLNRTKKFILSLKDKISEVVS